MRTDETAFRSGNDVLRSGPGLLRAYDELMATVRSAHPMLRQHPKSRPEYVYDQTALVKSMRDVLRVLGWRREEPLLSDGPFGGIDASGTLTDTARDGLHAVFDFGNRASWGNNMLTRVAAGFALGGIRVTCLVVPTHRFAARIDSNLVSFERVTIDMKRLAYHSPNMIPGPMLIIGIEPQNIVP